MISLTTRERAWLAAAAVGLLVFLFALVGYRTGALASWDAFGLRENAGDSPAGRIATALSFIGDTVVIVPAVVLAAAYLLWRRRPWAALRVVALPGAGEAWVLVTKELLHRPRPPNPIESGYGFPSGHATDAAIMACLLAWYALAAARPRAIVVALLAIGALWALVMAAARVALGVHYVTDVVGGLGSGLLVAGVGLAVLSVAEATYRKSRSVR